MYRQIIIPEKASLLLKLPKSFIGKMIEVIAFPIDKAKEGKDVQDKYAWKEALKFFDAHRRDLSNFKFDRDEANER